MIWLVIVVVVVVVLVLLSRQDNRPEIDRLTYQTMVDLHAIHRRFDLGWFKFELRRDAADAQRELRAELRKLEERERQT
jgi:hypothetical protein